MRFTAALVRPIRLSRRPRPTPNSPYAASKAAADHLVRAYNRTYGLQTTITNCSNNYGPYQFPEKLILIVPQELPHRCTASDLWGRHEHPGLAAR